MIIAKEPAEIDESGIKSASHDIIMSVILLFHLKHR